MALLLNLETSPIHDQVASATLDLQGNIVATTMSNNNDPSIDSTAAQLLYQIFLEVGSLHLTSFRRITISSSSLPLNHRPAGTGNDTNSIRYILTRDDAHIYIIAQKQ